MGSLRPIADPAASGGGRVGAVRWKSLPVDLNVERRYSVYVPAALLDVPYVPTEGRIVTEMLRLAGVGEGDVVYDLGCGDGRIVIAAAREFGATGMGIDIESKRIAEAVTNAQRAGVSSRVSFRQASFFDADVRDATVVTLFLLREINARLRPKLMSELRPGARIVTNHFDMKEWPADEERTLGYRQLFKWTVPAWVGGRWRCVIDSPQGRQHVRMDLERRFQSVVGTARVGRHDVAIQDGRLAGRELRFRLPDGRRFEGVVEGDGMRGRCGTESGECAWGAVREH